MFTVRHRPMVRYALCANFLVGQVALAQDTLRLRPIAEHATATLRVKGFADFRAIDGDHAWVTNEGRAERLAPNVRFNLQALQ